MQYRSGSVAADANPSVALSIIRSDIAVRVKNDTIANIRINMNPWQAGFACSPWAGYAGR